MSTISLPIVKRVPITSRLLLSERDTAKAREGEKRKRSNISADNDRPTSLEEDQAETEGRDKESVALIIVEKGKKVKVTP